MVNAEPATTLDGMVALEHDGGGKATRLALYRDGVELSRTWIVPYTLRIGRATVRMDGIGGVATPEEHRNQGYSRQVLSAAVERMKAGDAHLTALYGIPDYYPRWGYATAAHEGGIRITRLDRDAALPEGMAFRRATAADIPAIRAIYARETRDIVGSAVRPDDDTVWQELATSIAGEEDECRVIVDETGAVQAYAWMAAFIWWIQNMRRDHPDGLHIGEAFALTPRSADGLLAGVRQWAVEAGKAHVDLHQPASGALGMAARLQDTAMLAITFRDAQFMARSTGTRALVKALEPELRARWLGARAGWQGPLQLVADGEAASLRLTNDALDVAEDAPGDAVSVELSPGDLARLALGSFPPRDLLGRIGIEAEIVDVLSVLFPERGPYIYPADRF
jgi:hypothetical protein